MALGENLRIFSDSAIIMVFLDPSQNILYRTRPTSQDFSRYHDRRCSHKKIYRNSVDFVRGVNNDHQSNKRANFKKSNGKYDVNVVSYLGSKANAISQQFDWLSALFLGVLWACHIKAELFTRSMAFKDPKLLIVKLNIKEWSK